MKIRKAKLKDLNQLHTLFNNTAELKPPRSKDFFPKDYIKMQIKNPMIYFILAEEKNKVFGVLTAEIWKKEKFSYWSSFIVREKFRNKGIGSLLYKNYIDFLKKSGIVYINTTTKFNNVKMQKIFNKYKFKKRELLYFYDKELK